MGCNPVSGGPGAHAHPLSVSCVGSNGLQHCQDLFYPVVGDVSFSILCRIEWVATITQDHHACSCAVLSVSCVGSNGLQLNGYEAQNFQSPCSHFQYPVSDRMGCNPVALARMVMSVEIFQYPVSDRMGCNNMPGLWSRYWYQLSVSCVGSNGLQPCSHVARHGRAGDFQYPVSDRMGCNRDH